MKQKPCRKLLACAGLLIGSCSTTSLWAGAILDGTMGTPDPGGLTGDFVITEAMGKLEGTNLFHSFSDFNINSGESAAFFGSSSITNVISRVTGSGTSTFDGSLTALIDPAAGYAQTGANFIFINPNGLIFKEGAVLNIGGAFTATTSDYVNLGNDGVFFADAAAGSVFTSSSPSAFGFLDSNPGTISFEGTQMVKWMNLNPFTPSFSFIGGDISLDQAADGTATNYGTTTSRGTFLTGNRIELVSVGSAGEAVALGGDYDTSSFTAMGNIDILNGSVIDAAETYIKGGQIVVKDSVIAPGFFWVADMWNPADQPNGGSITIEATESIVFDGSNSPVQIAVDHPDPSIDPIIVTRFDGGPLFAGISVFAGDPFLNSGNLNVPDISITGGDVSLVNSASIFSQRFGPGVAGDIFINGDTVKILNGGMIANLNTYAGAGGNITINADQVIMDNEGNTTPVTGLTGLIASGQFNPVFGNPYVDPDFDGSGPPNKSLIYASDLASADSGNITVNATGPGGFTMLGAEITSESRSYGKAGNISVNASDIILSREGGLVGSVVSQSAFSGDAGHINITATNDIELRDGFFISASVSGTGTGGDVSVTAGNAISITGINYGTDSSGIASATVMPPPELEAFLASMYGFPDIQTMALVFYGGSPPPNADLFDVLVALRGMGFTDLDGANPVAGNAGSVSIAASSLYMNGDHAISSSTSSNGNGGSINVLVDTLSLNNGAEIRSRSGVIDVGTGELLVGTGNGGNVIVTASSSVTMDNASISASSLGNGLAGDISLNAGDTLDMFSSSVTTEALESDGGNINVMAIKRIYLNDSEISTSVGNGSGSGGNIDIDPEFVILQQSNILANAFGGPGGNINIIADNFLASPDSLVDASSALGIDGTVNIDSPEEDVSKDLETLPDNYLDVSSLLNERCGTAVGASSLVNAGPDGLTVDPDGYLPSFVASNNNEEEGEKNSVANGKDWWSPYAQQKDLQLAQVTCTF